MLLYFTTSFSLERCESFRNSKTGEQPLLLTSVFLFHYYSCILILFFVSYCGYQGRIVRNRKKSYRKNKEVRKSLKFESNYWCNCGVYVI